MAQPPVFTHLPIDQIQVGQRHRKDMGDIPDLAASIKELGLLQPIVVLPDYRLVAGQRRLEAMKSLGWIEVPAVIASDLDDALCLLQAERDENQCRKDFARSEAVALGRAIEAIEAPKAKQRQVERGGRPKNTGGKLPPVSDRGKTRDKVGEAVGMSGRSYDKVKAVVAAAEADPERFGPVVEEMDETGKVEPAYQQVKQQPDGKPTRKLAARSPAETGSTRKTVKH